MDGHTDKLEENILALFKQACRQGRLDVAEHLLCALEASSKEGDNDELPCTCEPLDAAYLTIAGLRSKV
ncbi:hypothetical protein [Ensifer adhaerens]|uniref:hypothetical protein n=1 Tax=Ensifer adhaerens TaxID=106592 RepID=UPI001C4DE880|nr:hypothetical protein [Ensifer adhaerens]MBW0368338.1 hypothetical protein [Ensifer adhaerens]UCM24924.1 hypothetical protein LDL63_34610 [Ensifer adhaerens]